MSLVAQRPFASLNLRWNPFGSVAERDRAGLAVVDLDVERLARRLREPGFAVQLTGEAGRGKSTHMRVLHSRFPGAPFVHCPEGEPPPSVPRAPVVFVDESQRIPPRARRRLFRRRASFVLATHECHVAELAAAGVEVHVVEVAGLDLPRLRRIVDLRLEWARRSPGGLPDVPDAVLRSCLAARGDDLRGIEDILYFWFQRLRDERIHERV